MGTALRTQSRQAGIRARFGRASAAALLAAGLLQIGCSKSGGEEFSYSKMEVASDSAKTGSGNTVNGPAGPLNLEGREIKVGDSLNDVVLAGAGLRPVQLASTKGKVRIISVVPSIDTKVCEQQTHYLSEKNNGLDQSVQLITVSIDTPFAQDRFAKAAKISNVTFLSDYRQADFGRNHGLLLEGPHLLARAVLVVDADDVIQYIQVTPKLGELPDMDKAFDFARKLAKS